MTKDELKTRLEAAEKQFIGLQDEIKNLKAKLNEAQEDDIPEFPTFNGGCSYFVNTNGIVEMLSPDSHGRETDYNGFHTHEYAQLFADKCKLIAMMLHCKWYLCRDFKEDFSKDDLKWYAYYANNTSHFAVDYCVNDDQGSVYFDTEKNAQKCADWLNAHWKEDGNG